MLPVPDHLDDIELIVEDAGAAAPNTKTCAVLIEGLACPLYSALPGLKSSGIRVGRPD